MSINKSKITLWRKKEIATNIIKPLITSEYTKQCNRNKLRPFKNFQAESVSIMDSIVSVFKNAIISDLIIVLPNIGKIRTFKKEQRRGRNPKTGAEAIISARTIVSMSKKSHPHHKQRATLITLAHELHLLHTNHSQTFFHVVLKDLMKLIFKIYEGGITVKISNLGSFSLLSRVGFTGTNPATSEPIEIPPQLKIHFKPANAINKALNS